MYENDIESNLIKATSLAGNFLPKDEINEVRAYYEIGQERFLAYEALCFALKQKNVNVSDGLYNLLEDIATLMDLEKYRYLHLNLKRRT